MVERSKLIFPKKNPQKPNRELNTYCPHLIFALGTEKGRGRESLLLSQEVLCGNTAIKHLLMLPVLDKGVSDLGVM